MKRDVQIIKANGEREPFSEEKLRSSLRRSGASEADAEDVVNHISDELEDGITTDKIYRHAYELLRRLEKPGAAGKYSLRRALLELGPTGFPFEKYVAELFRARGFETLVDKIVPGRCVEHEIDVVAWNSDKLIMSEVKYHNRIGEKSALKVVLYVKARFDDLSETMFDFGKRRLLDEGWIITNTKFTEKAVKYGECANVKMLGWNYPSKGNLRELIEDLGLHPVTSLSNISSREKQLLLNGGVVLCRQIKESSGKLPSLGLESGELKRIADEAEAICGKSA